MGKFDEVAGIASDFAHAAEFLTVYIEEAHPADGWAFNNNYVVKQHKTIQDRLAAIDILAAREPPFEIVADAIDNNGCWAYGGLFERLYIIMDGKIVYQGGRGPRLYFPKEVRNWLEQFCKNKSIQYSRQAGSK